MDTKNHQQQIDELIAKTTDTIRLDKLKKDSEQQQLDAMQQRLATLKGIPQAPATTIKQPDLDDFDDKDAEANIVLAKIMDELRLETLEKKSVSQNSIISDDTLYMENINSAELIDDTHQEETLTTFAKTTHSPSADKLTIQKPPAQGFLTTLQQLLNSLIPAFLTNLVNFFKQPSKPLEQTNAPLKPIKNEIASTSASTVAKQQAIKEEVQPQDWHKPTSIRHQIHTATAVSINKIAEDMINLQKEHKASIAVRKQALAERPKELLDNQSPSNNKSR